MSFIFFILIHLALLVHPILSWSFPFHNNKNSFDYDLVIIGGGASGLFASGAASLLGLKAAIIENEAFVGGDCTNAACVPSKALRSYARAYTAGNAADALGVGRSARQHVIETVKAVRRREDPKDIQERSNDNILRVITSARNCTFLNPHELSVVLAKKDETDHHHQQQTLTFKSRYFLLATGASPIIPEEWKLQARQADGLVLSSYRSLLRPPARNDDDDDPIWELISRNRPNNNEGDSDDKASTNRSPTRILIVGGGPTACELGQSLARISRGREEVEIEIVAPSILAKHDVGLQQAAIRTLLKSGIRACHLNHRLSAMLPNRTVQLTDGTVLSGRPFDAILVCVGRSPTDSLSSLRLDRAGVRWWRNNNKSSCNPEEGELVELERREEGVDVNPTTLQSTTAPHVYAAGDCAAGVHPRTATLAAWTGFHAARNMRVPWILRAGSTTSIHRNVPRVVYMDPEMASIGMDYTDCVGKYGVDGFDCICVDEEGSDRADMDRVERDPSSNFVELRVDAKSGRVLGCTACGPAASEIANSMGIVITNRMSVRDVARSIHSYPSHGYLLHRIALSLSLKDVWGVLDACGPVGSVIAKAGRTIRNGRSFVKAVVRVPHQRRKARKLREWQCEGASKVLYLQTVAAAATGGSSSDFNVSFNAAVVDKHVQVVSYLDVKSNSTLGQLVNETPFPEEQQAVAYLEWRQRDPSAR